MPNQELVNAKCKLYSALLKFYDGEYVIEDHDIKLMDCLVRDPDIQSVLQNALSKY